MNRMDSPSPSVAKEVPVMTRPAGLRMVLVVVCLCVIGCPFMTQGQRELPNFPQPYEPTGFCPPGSLHAIDVETSNMGTWGSVQIEECVTTNILIGGVYVDRYGYRVTNNCSIDLCGFSLPNNTGANSPCYTNLSGWTCTVTSGWQWAAQSWVSGIDPGSYGDFWIDVPTGTTVDAGVTGNVSFCFNQIANAVATTGPRSPLPNLKFTGVNDICCSGSCVWDEMPTTGGTITVSATVKNIGQSVSAGCYAIVETLSTCVSGTNFPPPEYVPPLSPGGTWPVTWTWSPTPSGVACLPSQGPGLFGCVLNIKVDVPNLVAESNENDNVATCPVCCKGPRADLTITPGIGTCTCVQGPFLNTCTITVNAVVKNIGNADTNSQCQAEIVDAFGASQGVPALVPPLAANGGSTPVQWMWTFYCDKLCPCVTLNPGTLTMTVNGAFTVSESNYLNNTATKVVCCH